jgi:methylmalonyl-CoA mutase N-terminal domain/subunit
MVEAIEQGFPQREVAESAYRLQQAVERREHIIVGVNDYLLEDEGTVPILSIDEGAAERQLARLERLRRERDGDRVGRALDAIRETAAGPGNLMGPLLEAARAYATVGEMCDALRDVWGEYEEVPSI